MKAYEQSFLPEGEVAAQPTEGSLGLLSHSIKAFLRTNDPSAPLGHLPFREDLR